MESLNFSDIFCQCSDTELQQLLIYILNRLSFPQVVANEGIQLALRDLFARASNNELSKILPNAPSSISKTDANLNTISKQSNGIRTKSAVSILKNVIAIDYFKEYKDPGSFWVREVTILDNFSPTDEPTLRYERICKATSKAKKEGIIVKRFLFLLQLHERDNALKRYKAQQSKATPFSGRKESNAYLADTHGLQTTQVKKLVTGWNKLISLMQRRGPGIALKLGGGVSTWVNMTEQECTAMELYLERHRPDVLEQSRSLDLIAVQFLRCGLLRAGMVNDNDGLRETKLGSIILNDETDDENAQHHETDDDDYDEAVERIASQLSKEAQLPSTEQLDGECGIPQINTPGQIQSRQTRKRHNENSQNTSRSKSRRFDVPRSGAATTTNCGANTNNENAGVRQSEMALGNIRDGQSPNSTSEQSPGTHAADTSIHDRRTDHGPSAEAQRSDNPSASTAGSTTSSNTTSDIDNESNAMSSERTSVDSMCGDASCQWVSSSAAGCNSQFRLVNNGLSAGQADLLPSTFRNPQVASNPIPTMSEEQLSSRQHQYSSATDHVFQPGVSNLDWQQPSNLQETRNQVESGTSLHDNTTQGHLPRDMTPALDDFQPPEFELFPQIPEFDLFPQSSSLLDSSSLPDFDVLSQLHEFDLFPLLSTSSALPCHISPP